MIVYKDWVKTWNHGTDGVTGSKWTTYYYQGWFLLGILPLFIKRRHVESY
jgi:hypothetical protein